MLPVALKQGKISYRNVLINGIIIDNKLTCQCLYEQKSGVTVKAEDRKAHILECAKKLFSEYGYHKTQISDIVKMAKIARGTVYQYFKNKDDLFITLLENHFYHWRQVIREMDATIDFSTITPVQFFQHRIRTTLQFFSNDHDLCNIVLRMGIGLHESLETVVKKLEKDIQTIIKDEIQYGQSLKKIDAAMDTDLLANVLVGAVLRASYFYFVQEREAYKDKSVDEIADEITRIFAPGIFLA